MLNVIFTSSITQMIVYPGLEEELAEAIDKDFYDSYKTWTLDNQNASSSQKVCVSDKNKI